LPVNFFTGCNVEVLSFRNIRRGEIFKDGTEAEASGNFTLAAAIKPREGTVKFFGVSIVK
jgi:hypothetical protein